MKFVVRKSVIRSLIKSVISAIVLCFAIGTGAAFAQAPAAPATPTTAAAPAVPTPAPSAATAALAPAKIAKPKLSPDEKKKLSQECSAQANEKKLHGKDRRTFRATCIRHGGAAA